MEKLTQFIFKHRLEIGKVLTLSFYFTLLLFVMLVLVLAPLQILKAVFTGVIFILLIDCIFHYSIQRLKYNYEYKLRKRYEAKYGQLDD